MKKQQASRRTQTDTRGRTDGRVDGRTDGERGRRRWRLVERVRDSVTRELRRVGPDLRMQTLPRFYMIALLSWSEIKREIRHLEDVNYYKELLMIPARKSQHDLGKTVDSTTQEDMRGSARLDALSQPAKRRREMSAGAVHEDHEAAIMEVDSNTCMHDEILHDDG